MKLKFKFVYGGAHMLPIQVKGCTIVPTNSRTLTITSNCFNLWVAAVCLLYEIDQEEIDNDIFILDLKGVGVRTFNAVFEKVCDRAGFKDKKVLSKKFKIQAENGTIVFNSNFSSEIYAVGKLIPG